MPVIVLMAKRAAQAHRLLRERPRILPNLDRLLRAIVSVHAQVRDRRQLASLDDRMLRDIGMDRCAVENDSTASFWRLR